MSPFANRNITQTLIMEEAGQKLKRIRERLRLKYREVEEYSSRIAQLRGSDEYVVALSRLADIENKGTVPSVFRLYSLCAIYKLDLPDVLSWYGISLSNLPADSGLTEIPETHLVNFKADDGEVQFPISIEPGLDVSKTLFLSRFIQRWGKLPLLFLNRLDLKNQRYGLIGTEDWSMYPVISPGAIVVIDETRRRVVNSGWNNEFERPIYFLEHRSGYACSWCSLREKRLILQPHPASGYDPENFDYPDEIDIIGQVTQVAMTVDPAARRRNP
jgi:transcriptional regulator with XRE-family HTH domain